MNTTPRRTTLFRQFILKLIPPLLGTLFLALAANIFVGYHMAYKEQSARQALISRAYAQSLTKPLWDCDDKTAQGIMDSMLQAETINGSVVKSSCTGQTLRSGVPAESDDDRFHSHRTLEFRDTTGRLFTVGELDICFKPVSVMQGATDSLWFYLLVTMALALCLISVTLLVFRNLISRPLEAFQQVIRESGTNPVIQEVLPIGQRNDELTDVLKAYDRLMGTIAVQQDTLAQQARLDPLTGLGNRLHLHECLQAALEKACRMGGTGYVMLFDLDGFKPINDTLGHAAGDFVLKIVAKRLLKAVREGDVVIRLGGDEFVVILDPHAPPLDAQKVKERIRSQIAAPISYEGQYINVGTSIGMASFGPEAKSCDALLTEADHSMYADKNARRAGR